MKKILIFSVILAYIVIMPVTSWAEDNLEGEKLTSKPDLLAEYLIEAGYHLKKAYKIREEGRSWISLGEFSVPSQIGIAGEQLIGASTVISPQRAPLMEKAGKELKSYRNRRYWSTTLFLGGLLTMAIGAKSKTAVVAGGLSMLTGEGIGIMAPCHMKSAGKALEDISGDFQTPDERKLMERAGESLQSYAKYTYWGWGLQGTGMTAAIVGFANENTGVGVIGIGTTLIGMFLRNTIAPSNIGSAGERLEELGNVLQ